MIVRPLSACALHLSMQYNRVKIYSKIIVVRRTEYIYRPPVEVALLRTFILALLGSGISSSFYLYFYRNWYRSGFIYCADLILL